MVDFVRVKNFLIALNSDGHHFCPKNGNKSRRPQNKTLKKPRYILSLNEIY